MSQPSVIVFSDSDVDNVPMLGDNQIFTSQNTFNGATVLNGAISGTAYVADLATKADALTSDQNYVTDAQLTVIENTSGTNTGDQDLSGKADAVHTHVEADITDLGAYITDISGQDLSTADNTTSAFITGADVPDNETDPVFTAWDKDYDDLTNKPTLYTSSDFDDDFGSADLADLTTKNYEDLTVTVASKSADYTITTESMILVTTGGVGTVTITLPSAVTRRTPITVKFVLDGGSDCIIVGAGGASIDGAVNKTLDTVNESITVMSNGTNWYIIGLVGSAT